MWIYKSDSRHCYLLRLIERVGDPIEVGRLGLKLNYEFLIYVACRLLYIFGEIAGLLSTFFVLKKDNQKAHNKHKSTQSLDFIFVIY